MRRSCRQVDEVLPAYRESSLPARRQRQVEEHLRGCPDCRRRLAALDRATDALQRWQPAAPPAGALGAFRARLAAEEESRPERVAAPPRRAGWLLPGLAAAAAAVALTWARPTPEPGTTAQVQPPPASIASRGPDEARRATSGETQPGTTVAERSPAPTVDASPATWPAPAATPAHGTRSHRATAKIRRERGAASTRRAPARQPEVTPTPPAVRGVPQAVRVAVLRTAEARAPMAAPASVTPPAAGPDAEEPEARHVEIAAEAVDVMDPYTGETRQIIVARVVDRRSGRVHITLAEPGIEALESEETNDG